MVSSCKKTRGKGKIEIKIFENMDDRLIIKSMCTVIYHKISEISTLCGGEILFIILSPTGMPYSFCHPSAQSAGKQFFNANQPLNDTIYGPVEAFRK
ncbi:hypothetical protein Gotri_004202, partial [Gossypium trilobum]|nr:hypothetical protein [Gossypium trilobum]